MTTFLAVVQDLTLFDPNDDDAPLLGTYAGGVVTSASFSTDPAHARAYLKFTESLPGSTVNFSEGTGEIAQCSVEVIDKRITPSDQNTGIFTWLAAAADGDTALLGGRAIVRQKKWDGSMGVAMDGVVYDVKLITGRSFVTYRLVLRDIRERERAVRLFVGAVSTAVFPLVGPADGYGWNTQWNAGFQDFINVGAPAMPPVAGLKAKVIINAYGGGSDFLTFQFTDPGGPNGYFAIPKSDYALWEGRTEQLKPTWDLVGKIQPVDPTNTDASPDSAYFAPGVFLDWSAYGPNGPWTTIERPFVPFGLRGYTSILQIFPEDWKQGNPLIPHQIVIMRPTDVALRPTHGGTVWVRLRSNRAPSKDIPLWIEAAFGDLLADIYDGEYSYPGLGMNVRYNAAQMVVFKRAAGKALAKITEPVADGRPWIAEHIYRATGYVPAIRGGVVFPVAIDLPDSSVSLPVIDDSVVYPGEAEWEHGSGEIINHGEFIFERDLVPADYSKTGVVLTQEVTIQRDNGTSQARHGSKPVTFQPVTVREVFSYDANQGMPNPDVSHEDAAKRGLHRVTATIRRYANGAQRCVAVCRSQLIESLGVASGSWVQFGPSWLPDYVTRVRGINRVMQIESVEPMTPTKARIILSDGGPYSAPIARPTAVTITENADHTLSVAVTGVPTTGGPNPRATVQLAFGETQPTSDSGEWKTIGILAANGSVFVATHPSGLNAWARAQGVADGVRSSIWRVASPLRLATIPGLRQARLTINPFDAGINPGYAHAAWEALADAAGVRIHYKVFGIGDAEPDALTDSIDVDATDLEADIIALEQWEQIVIQLEPYSGFGSGAVSGTAGPMTSRMKAQRRDEPYIAPTVAVDVSRSGGVGTVTLTPTDPQGQILEYWFRHRSGNAGSWSSWAQDTSAPYADNVTIPPGQGSAIEYQVIAYLSNGSTDVIAQDVVEFARTDSGPSISVDVSSNEVQATITYDGVGTIQYAIDRGTPSTPPASPFTVLLDAASHFYRFTATGDDAQEISDTVTIPAKKPAVDGSDATIDDVTLNITDAPCDMSSGEMEVSWTTTNMPGGETFDVTVVVFGGSAPAGTYDFPGVSSGDPLSPIALCPDSSGSVSVTAKLAGVPIATGSANFFSTI